MIIQKQKDEAESAGVIETIDVGISSRLEDQLMILNILSDTLYTDKISAVWREYGCNGSDANIEAGRKNVPIEISLPTVTNPSAVIRDFGFGMSEDQVKNTYCKAGASTKRGSNELIGCLGIGSKAGYAYGPAFTVTSFHKGQKTVYNCFKDGGIPRMAILQQVATGERDGVEISVPVRRPDIEDFVKRAERVFRYFKVRPTVKNGSLQYQQRESLLKGTGWTFTGGGESIAIMGNVGYALDMRQLPSDFPPKKRQLIEAGIEIEFPIGALEIAANRESIQYKDATLKQISHALGVGLDEIAGEFTKRIKDAPTLWAAKIVYHNMFDKTGSYSMQQMRDAIGSKVTWNGIIVKSSRFRLSVDVDGGANNENYIGVSVLEYSQSSWHSRGKRLSKYNNPHDCVASDKTQLILNDNKSHAISVSKVRYWFEQHSTCERVIIFTFQDDKGKVAYLKDRHLETTAFMRMTAMPKPPLIPGQSSGVSEHRAKHQARALEFDETKGEYAWPRSTYWLPAIVDKTQPAIYVTLSAFEPDDSVFRGSNAQLKAILIAARKAGFLSADEKLIGIKIKDGKPAMQLGAKWISFSHYLADKVVEAFQQNAALPQEFADYIETTEYKPFLHSKAKDKLVQGSPARILLEEYIRMRDGSKYQGLHAIYTRCPKLFKAVLPKPTKRLTDEEKIIWTRYPMLKWAEYDLRNSDSPVHLKKAADYINMVELMNLTAGTTSKPAV